jgi:Cd2+/Zn2+-exporting ATPase
MGVAGTDAALETADVALMADELAKIPFALRLSRATARNIRINIAFSLGLKAAFLVMALAGAATLWMAVVADMGASLIVIANALRLLRE